MPGQMDPKFSVDLHYSCHWRSKSTSKADDTWVILERAKEQNYRLSGRG